MALRTLFRPVGPKELALIEASGFRGFPPRLPEQPIFYPVLNAEYACEIAQQWEAPESGVGYVTRFQVNAAFLDQFPVKTVGAARHQELWVPAQQLAEFNHNLVGLIEVIATFRRLPAPTGDR